MLWPIGCGVFRHDPAIVSSSFIQTIKPKKMSSFFTEIIMVIYDPIRYDKNRRFFDFNIYNKHRSK